MVVAAPRVKKFQDRKSTRLNSSHVEISYAVFCLKKKRHHRQAHRARARIGGYEIQSRASQRADWTQAQIAPQLQPDLVPDVGSDRRLQSRFLHGPVQPLDPPGSLSTGLADRKF